MLPSICVIVADFTEVEVPPTFIETAASFVTAVNRVETASCGFAAESASVLGSYEAV